MPLPPPPRPSRRTPRARTSRLGLTAAASAAGCPAALTRVLVHYLGDDAYQTHGVPPQPARVVLGGTEHDRDAEPMLGGGGGGGGADAFAGSIDADVATTALQLSIRCRLAPSSLPLLTCDVSESDVLGLNMPVPPPTSAVPRRPPASPRRPPGSAPPRAPGAKASLVPRSVARWGDQKFSAAQGPPARDFAK